MVLLQNRKFRRICSSLVLILKAPRKNASENWCLLKSSAANNCLTLLTNLSIEVNSVDPEQTAPIDLGPHCLP